MRWILYLKSQLVLYLRPLRKLTFMNLLTAPKIKQIIFWRISEKNLKSYKQERTKKNTSFENYQVNLLINDGLQESSSKVHRLHSLVDLKSMNHPITVLWNRLSIQDEQVINLSSPFHQFLLSPHRHLFLI